MKFLSILLAATTVVVTAVFALPAASPVAEKPEDIRWLSLPPGWQGNDHGQKAPDLPISPSVPTEPVSVIERQVEDPRSVCDHALAAWRVCVEPAQTCREKLCSTPASANVNSCDRIRQVCELQESMYKPDETLQPQNTSNLVEAATVRDPGDQIVNLYTRTNFLGFTYYFITVMDVQEHQCKQIPPGVEIASLKLYDMESDYWCRIFGRIDCEWEGLVYADLPGATEYDVNDLRKRWDHSMGSIKCYMAPFQVVPPGA